MSTQFSERDQRELDTELWTSAKSGYLEKVKQALQNGANLKYRHWIATPRTTPHTVAYINGHNTTVQLLENAGATPNYTEIMLAAAANGLVDKVKEAIEKKIDINAKHSDFELNSALHYASLFGHTETVQFLLQSNADPNICNKWGQTPLHIAYWYDHHNIVKLLCSFGGDLDQVRNDDLLLTSAKNSDIKNVNLALTSGANINVHYSKEYQQTALHLASEGGHCDIVTLLLNSNADPNICDEYQQRPAHFAAEKGYVNALKLLIKEGRADVNARDQYGNTLLHSACSCGSEDTIQYLLNDVKLNPLAVNNRQQIPLERISPNLKDRFQLLKLFQPFLQHNIEYPVDSYAKLFLCGKTNAGKSSLAAVISYRADKGRHHDYNAEECVEGVVLQTTGIDYHSIRSKEVGNVVILDFAGHAEYYSSHAAVLETLLSRSPAVFVIVTNLTYEKEIIKRDLYFWFTFIENVSTNLINPSQVIIVGSHIDLLPHENDYDSFVNEIASSAIRDQNYTGFLAMDCHRPGGKGVEEFMTKLKKSREAVIDKEDKISYHCHCLHAFLQQLQLVAISLDDLCSRIKNMNEPCLLSDRSTVLKFLTILGEKGLVLFLRDWLIIDQKALLTEVNGIIFNESIDRVCKPITSNTGIMPVSTLAKLFPNHDTKMLIRFLISLQFCHQINSHSVNNITNNIPSEEPPVNEDTKYLFFPALIKENRPSPIFNTTDGFGWCLWCPNPLQFLPIRFLHTLLRHLAYTRCLPPDNTDITETNIEVKELYRDCTMWKNGIYWKDENDIEVMVEVTEYNRCVTILVSHSGSLKSYEIRTSLIKEVLSLKNKICSCEVQQFLIPPGNMNDVSEKEQRHRILYSLRKVALGVITKSPIGDVNNKTAKRLDVRSIVGEKEPYLCIAPIVIVALFTESNNDILLPHHYIRHIKEACREIMPLSSYWTHLSVRKRLDQFSIFTGRNPLTTSSRPIRDEEIHHLSEGAFFISKNESVTTNPNKQMQLSSTYDISGNEESKECTSTDDYSPFPKLFVKPTRHEVLIQLACIDASWREIGDGLGVNFNKLRSLAKSIDEDQTKLSEVIQIWIDMDGKDDGAPVTWITILDLLNGPLVNNKALAMKIYQSLKEERTNEEITQEHTTESGPANTNEGYNTDNVSMEHQQHFSNELSNEPKQESLTSDSTQQGNEPSQIFLDYFADICDAIEVKPLPIVKRLLTARLISSNFKDDVESMSGDNYDKADKVVNELQRQVKEKGIDFLKAICDFLLNQNHMLKDIGTKMKCQLESLTPPN